MTTASMSRLLCEPNISPEDILAAFPSHTQVNGYYLPLLISWILHSKQTRTFEFYKSNKKVLSLSFTKGCLVNIEAHMFKSDLSVAMRIINGEEGAAVLRSQTQLIEISRYITSDLFEILQTKDIGRENCSFMLSDLKESMNTWVRTLIPVYWMRRQLELLNHYKLHLTENASDLERILAKNVNNKNLVFNKLPESEIKKIFKLCLFGNIWFDKKSLKIDKNEIKNVLLELYLGLNNKSAMDFLEVESLENENELLDRITFINNYVGFVSLNEGFSEDFKDINKAVADRLLSIEWSLKDDSERSALIEDSREIKMCREQRIYELEGMTLKNIELNNLIMANKFIDDARREKLFSPKLELYNYWLKISRTSSKPSVELIVSQLKEGTSPELRLSKIYSKILALAHNKMGKKHESRYFEELAQALET